MNACVVFVLCDLNLFILLTDERLESLNSANSFPRNRTREIACGINPPDAGWLLPLISLEQLSKVLSFLCCDPLHSS